jgi:hypothetical protein
MDAKMDDESMWRVFQCFSTLPLKKDWRSKCEPFGEPLKPPIEPLNMPI